MPTSHPDAHQLCTRALDEAQRELAALFPARVASTDWYGAVEVDPVHLVVWVLLNGDPEDVPVWYFPDKDQPGDRYDPALLADIRSMRETVVAAFARNGWPDADRMKVGFESTARVTAGGGRLYFK